MKMHNNTDISGLMAQLKATSIPSPQLRQSGGKKRVSAIGFLILSAVVLTSYYFFGSHSSEALAPSTLTQTTAPQQDSRQIEKLDIPDSTSILSASGYLVPRESALIGAELSGKIASLRVEEGDYVKKGQVIALLDAQSQLAEVEYVKAQLKLQEEVIAKIRAEHKQSEADLQRMTTIERKGLASEQKLEQSKLNLALLGHQLKMEALQADVIQKSLDIQFKQLEKTSVKSPFNGIIAEVLTRQGEYTTPVYSTTGTSNGIVRILSTSDLRGETFINEKYVNKVHEGQQVTITPLAYSNLKITGTVERIIPIIRKESSTVKIVISQMKNQPELLPNMRIDVNFQPYELLSNRNSQ